MYMSNCPYCVAIYLLERCSVYIVLLCSRMQLMYYTIRSYYSQIFALRMYSKDTVLESNYYVHFSILYLAINVYIICVCIK